MRSLILVKHSLPEILPDVPASRWRLSDEGRRRCKPLAERLRAFSPTAIVTSVEPKAAETGAIVARQLGVPVETADGLHEHVRDNVGFVSTALFEERVARIFATPDQLVFGDETARQAQTRFRDAVDGVVARFPQGNVVVVAHGTVISLLTAERAGVDPLPLWKRLGLPSLVVISLPDWTIREVIDDVTSSLRYHAGE